jgi:hypothetical protein
MKLRSSLVCGIGLVLAMSLGSIARADTTLGSISVPPEAELGFCDGDVIAEVESDPSTPYTVPSAGTITSWRVAGFAAPGVAITLVVLKNTGGQNYSVVGADTQTAPNPVPEVLSFTVGSPIAVSGGEILALYEPSGDFVCYVNDDATLFADALISLDTLSTPTAGQPLTEDDFSGGGYRLNLEATFTPSAQAPTPTPTPIPPATHKKKCKKKKHKRSADSAKKKKCKKKKKR